MAAKNPGLFYAYLILSTKDSSSWDEHVKLVFANVETADEWWKAITDNASKWPSDFRITKDELKRHSPQFFTWPTPSDPKNILRRISIDPAMAALRTRWSYQCTTLPNGSTAAVPAIPLQDADGWPIAQPDAVNGTVLAGIQKTLEELKAQQGSGGAGGGGGGGAHGESGGGANWVDGASGPGGYASYAVVEAAYAKAKQLKDSGDDRSFGMIFAQLSMEMRRKA